MSNAVNRYTAPLGQGAPAGSTRYNGTYKTIVNSNVYVGSFVKVIESRYGPKLVLQFSDIKDARYAAHCEPTSLPVTVAPP